MNPAAMEDGCGTLSTILELMVLFFDQHTAETIKPIK